MAIVLCTGANRVLMDTRRMMLEQAGHQVVATMNDDELAEACKRHKFDVAIIGQGVSTPQKKQIFAILQEHCPGAKVLELFTSGGGGKALPKADDWLYVPAELPQHLAERVNALAEKAAPKKAGVSDKPPSGKKKG